METVKINENGVDIFVTEAENYIQINDLIEKQAESTWEYLLANYPSFDLFFSFNSERMKRSEAIPTQFLAEINAELVDDTLNFTLKAEDLNDKNSNNLETTRLTEAEFDTFAKFHDAKNPNIYWTSKRIKARFDLWQIQISKKGNQINGYSMLMITEKIAEIFTIYAENELIFEALLQESCKNAFAESSPEILYLIDRVEIKQQQCARKLGFKETGFYRGYQVKL